MVRDRHKQVIARRRRNRARRTARLYIQSRLVQSGFVLATVVMLLVVVWWFVDRSEPAAGKALHQFNTQDFHSLAFDPIDTDTIYFGHHEGLKMSADGGETWEDAGLSGIDVMQLAMSTDDPERRYAAGHDVFYVSTDGGRAWYKQPNNLPGLDLHTFAGSPSDANRLYAVPLGHGLWTSMDGGVTWTEATLPAGAETQPIVLAVSPSDPETVYLARNGEIATSTDAGLTWQSQPGPGGMITAIAIAPDANETLYVGTNQGLYRQDDSWRRLVLDPDRALFAVALSPTDPARLAVIDAVGNLYRSDDAGTTWQTQ